MFAAYWILAVTLALPTLARAQQPQVPSVHAVSLQRSASVARSSTARYVGQASYTSSTKSTNRMAAVKVTLRSFQKPIAPYEVQCFFVAKDYAKMRYVFDAKKVHSSATFDEINIFGKGLDGGTQNFEQETTHATLPGQSGASAQLNRNRLETRQLTTVRSGSSLEGWIVRVISGGKVVRTETSLQELKGFAEQEVVMLDEIAKGTPVTR